MVEHRLHRPLGTFEAALTVTGEHAPFVVVAVIHFDGGPTPERLRRVLDELQRKHPLLRVRIVRHGKELWYDSEEVPRIPFEILQRQSDGHWVELAEAELNRRFDAEKGPLLRCSYLKASPDEGSGAVRSDLVLTFHHAVMDGTSGTVLVNRLLELAAAQDAELCEEAEEALPPVETFFPARFRGSRGRWQMARYLGRQIADEVRFRMGSRGGRRPSVDPSARCRIYSAELSCEATEALARRLRRERLTVATALNAAFLLAAFRHLYGGRNALLRYINFANLRPYLRPPVEEHHLGSFISMLRFTARLGEEPSFWPLAHRLSRQVEAGLRRGEKFTAALLAQTLMRTLIRRRSERMAATAVSYAGVTRLEPGREGARTAGMHAFVSNVDLGPELTAQARILDGRLRIDAVVLDTDMDEALAGKIMDEILWILGTAGREAADPGPEA
ncbi:MAG: hypothetical protein KDD47_02715 [Acidobacteria bacterium]|nr:hypothetical protein [Acidobacteriota bacterium]